MERPLSPVVREVVEGTAVSAFSIQSPCRELPGQGHAELGIGNG